MRKFSKLGYRLSMVGCAASGGLAILFGIVAAILDSNRWVALTLVWLGIALVLGVALIHFHLRELIRVLLPAIGRVATTRPVAAAPVQAVAATDEDLNEAVRDLARTTQLSRNNELHLLDALQAINARLDEAEPARHA